MNNESYIDDDDDSCEFCGRGPYDCRCDIGDECGRWVNGKLTKYCSKAGSEECDFECPYRDAD